MGAVWFVLGAVFGLSVGLEIARRAYADTAGKLAKVIEIFGEGSAMDAMMIAVKEAAQRQSVRDRFERESG